MNQSHSESFPVWRARGESLGAAELVVKVNPRESSAEEIGDLAREARENVASVEEIIQRAVIRVRHSRVFIDSEQRH